MSSTCIKNGIVVHLVEYGNMYLRADIYRISDVYVLVGTQYFSNNPEQERVDMRVALQGNTINRKSGGYELLVLPRENCSFLNPTIRG